MFFHLKSLGLRRLSCLAFFTCGALGASLTAQESGHLSGRVYEAETGRSLQGAVVSVEGTGLRDFSDVSGRFSISGVPVGGRVVRVSYVGLEGQSLPVTVETGAYTEINVAMASIIYELEELAVTAKAVGQTQAINQQKNASSIMNIVSEDAFGAILDGNIGQALQRLPGISVDEDQSGSPGSINIRGISGEFNSVQIDGNRVPSSGGSRSFNPRDLAADGVTTIEVVKAPTPDMDGDAIGGIVNLVSRNAFQRDGRQIKLKGSALLNDISDKWGHSASLQYSDLISVGKGDKNLGISFTVSNYDTDRYSINADQDWVQVDPENNPELDIGQYNRPVWFMESTHWEYDTRKTNNTTFSGSIDYRLDDRNSLYFRPMISAFDRSGVQYETDTDIDTRFQNAVGGRKTYAALTPTYGRGTEDSEASMGWIGTLDEQENFLYSFSTGGRHERDSSVLTYDFYYSHNERDTKNDDELNMLMEPEDPWFVFEYNVIDPKGFVELNILNGVDPTDLSQMTEGELEEVTAEKTEEVYSFRVDWEKTLLLANDSLFIFKTGLKYRNSDQSFDRTVDLYEMDETFPYADVLRVNNDTILLKKKYFDVQPAIGKQLLRSNPSLFEFVEDDSLQDSNVADYDADETTSAAYVMGTWKSGIHTIVAGVRFEENKWKSTNKIVSYLDEVPSVTTVRNSNSESFWLPGVHLRHALAENLILRESYNRSYGRPRLSELSAGRWIDDDGNIEDGNPDLESAVSDNFDIQLEYYTEQGGLYSIGFFYKDVKDFSYTEVYDFDQLDQNGIPIPAEDGDLEYERPVNGNDATNYGLELIARQPMSFLPGPLKGLILSLSATFTDSSADYPGRTDDRDLPLEGFSEILYTAALDYVWGDFKARVDYRYRDEYIEGLGDDIESDEFYDKEYRLDAEVSYRIRENLWVFVTGTNLTNEPQVSYQGYPGFVEDASYHGRKYTFGVELTF